MKASTTLSAIIVAYASLSLAQDAPENPQVDPVVAAAKELEKNEIKDQTAQQKSDADTTAVPDQTGETPTTIEANPSTPETVTDAAPAAILVTGKPPATDPAAEASTQAITATDPGTQAAETGDGLAVRVEKLQTGTGVINPSQVKLLAPFPAKPLASAPAGWHLDPSDSAPPITREVEIAPGTRITLNIRPHLLVPDADGAETFAILEPGYDSTLGYRQSATVGAILSSSIRQLEDDSKRLGTAIDNLQQILISLPKLEKPLLEEKSTTSRKR